MMIVYGDNNSSKAHYIYTQITTNSHHITTNSHPPHSHPPLLLPPPLPLQHIMKMLPDDNSRKNRNNKKEDKYAHTNIGGSGSGSSYVKKNLEKLHKIKFKPKMKAHIPSHLHTHTQPSGKVPPSPPLDKSAVHKIGRKRKKIHEPSD